MDLDGQMRLSVRLPHSWCGSGPDAIRRVAEACEELGFWGVSVHDHLLVDPAHGFCRDGSRNAHDMYEALGVLSFVAGFTRRVKLITTVIVLGFRSPVLLAKEVATLDNLSGGRLLLGVGVGALRGRASDQGYRLSVNASIARKEFDALNVRGHRGAMADEHLEAMEALWTRDRSSYHGRLVSFEDFAFFPKPLQRPRPPIWVGGRSEAALRRVVFHGDGWIPSHENPAHYDRCRRRIEEIAAEAGRPAPGGWGLNVDATIAPTEAEAEQTILRAYGHVFESHQALRDACLAGSPEGWLEQLARWRALGVQLVDLKLVPMDLESTLAQLRLIARRVLPALPSLG
jgi:alkanesulfonate monooxygenase SsuD/methylene tetrahydromethanopterin reductase-like flavin-dependent oxidoreductase (luciferase family)